MQVLHQICAGMDVHKKDVKVCLVTRDSQGQRQEEVRSFRTMTRDVLAMRAWLQGQGCTIIAIESTGVYWKPIFNLFEGDFTVLLVNPSHIKQVPGRKTDVKDCRWIAELLEHGLLRGSFIPPVEMRDLRDLTRYRRQLVNTHSAEVNRLQKVLEDANIKLASVATDVMGVSGRAILRALLAGVVSPEALADLAKGRLRKKKQDLQAALLGRFRPHHTQLLTHILAHIEFLEESIAECEAQIEALCRPFAEVLHSSTRFPASVSGQPRISSQKLASRWRGFPPRSISAPGPCSARGTMRVPASARVGGPAKATSGSGPSSSNVPMRRATPKRHISGPNFAGLPVGKASNGQP